RSRFAARSICPRRVKPRRTTQGELAALAFMLCGRQDWRSWVEIGLGFTWRREMKGNRDMRRAGWRKLSRTTRFPERPACLGPSAGRVVISNARWTRPLGTVFFCSALKAVGPHGLARMGRLQCILENGPGFSDRTSEATDGVVESNQQAKSSGRR